MSRLKVQVDSACHTNASAIGSRMSSRSAALSETKGLLWKQCLFCSVGRKTRLGKVESLSRCETDIGEASIKEAARLKNDFIMIGRIEGVDLIAKEVRLHGSCRRQYKRIDDRNRSVTDNEEHRKYNKKAVYDEAFQIIVKYVKDNVLGNDGVIVQLSMLKDKYLDFIKENSPANYNPNHKTCKLKDKLVSYFGTKISFQLPHYGSELVFSSDICW